MHTALIDEGVDHVVDRRLVEGFVESIPAAPRLPQMDAWLPA